MLIILCFRRRGRQLLIALILPFSFSRRKINTFRLLFQIYSTIYPYLSIFFTLSGVSPPSLSGVFTVAGGRSFIGREHLLLCVKLFAIGAAVFLHYLVEVMCSPLYGFRIDKHL